VAHGRVSRLRAGGVEERHEDALLHELVDLGHSLVKRRRVRWHVGVRQVEKVVTDFGWEVDLTQLARRTMMSADDGDLLLAGLIHECTRRSSDAIA
jgi:hypothetical protein